MYKVISKTHLSFNGTYVFPLLGICTSSPTHSDNEGPYWLVNKAVGF